MRCYSATVAQPSASELLVTSASGQARICRIRGSYVSGALATDLNIVEVDHVTGGTTPTNQTPEKQNTRSATAQSTFAKAWVGLPTLGGNILFPSAGQNQGMQFDWASPRPWAMIEYLNGEEGSGALPGENTPVIARTLFWLEGPPGAMRRVARRGRDRGVFHWAAHECRLSGPQAIPRAMPPAPWVGLRPVQRATASRMTAQLLDPWQDGVLYRTIDPLLVR